MRFLEGAVYEVAPLGEIIRNSLGEDRAPGATVIRAIGEVQADHPATAPPPKYPAPPYFHGGRPGLDVGGEILPPLWSEEPPVRDEQLEPTWHDNGARVWLTPSLNLAWGYAHRFKGGGDVYEARPVGGAEFWERSSNSAVVAEAAVVVAVVARAVDRPVPEVPDPRHPHLQ
jgi:hypothetical protein